MDVAVYTEFGAFPASVALTIAVSHLSFHYFETPFLRMKEHLNCESTPIEHDRLNSAGLQGNRTGRLSSNAE